MLEKRIIPCLGLKYERVVKEINVTATVLTG
jgi:imidazole glycerol phosphate synthase subunit HisF